MTTICELPTVSEPQWADDERDTVEVDGFTYRAHYLDIIVDEVRGSLARVLAAQEFVASERERSRLDCAGENARLGYFQAVHATLPAMAWEHLKPSQRAIWVAAAKAVLDGEH